MMRALLCRLLRLTGREDGPPDLPRSLGLPRPPARDPRYHALANTATAIQVRADLQQRRYDREMAAEAEIERGRVAWQWADGKGANPNAGTGPDAGQERRT